MVGGPATLPRSTELTQLTLVQLSLLRLVYDARCGKVYLLRRAVSVHVHRVPIVHGQFSNLVEQRRNVHFFAPTQMYRIVSGQGSDWGYSWHNDTATYSKLFSDIRSSEIEANVCDRLKRSATRFSS